MASNQASNAGVQVRSALITSAGKLSNFFSDSMVRLPLSSCILRVSSRRRSRFRRILASAGDLSRGPDTAGVDNCCSDLSADGGCRGVIALVLNPDDDEMQCWRM